MSQTWTELLRVADNNSRQAAEEVNRKSLEADRQKREKLNKKVGKVQTVNEKAVKMILERRRQAQQQEKLAEEQRLKRANEIKKQQKSILQSKKQRTQKFSESQPLKTTPIETSKARKKQIPSCSYEDLMRYASLRSNKQPIPKELAHAVKLSTSRPTSTLSTTSSKAVTPTSTSARTTAKLKNFVSSSSSLPKTKTVTENNSTTRPSNLNTTKPTKLDESIRSSSNTKSSVTSMSHFSSMNRTTKPTQNQITTKQNQMSKARTLPPKQIIKPTLTNQQRLIHSYRTTNGSFTSSRKCPEYSTDEEDDEDMRDFIVDDNDDDENGCDYRIELKKTLKKNYGFDRDKRCFPDDDEDDLRGMEATFDQITKEEDYSKREGLREDIEEILREDAEKKRRHEQLKKRPKTAI